MNPEPIFRQLQRSELDTVIGWAAAEGWNPGLHDAPIFWETDPEAYLGIEWKGELIGSGAIVAYGKRLGFMGLFIVKAEWRGQGIGRKFWYHRRDTLLRRLEPGASIAMDGVLAMQPFYAKGGFVYSHNNPRMEGIGQPASPGPNLVELSSLPFESILNEDTRYFGAPRPAFLAKWIKPVGGLALGFLRGDELLGYGVVRPSTKGFRIGPLFARNPEVAEELFVALSAHAAGQPVCLDTPGNNPEALALAARHGMQEVFACGRMVFGPPPNIPWNHVFGVSTFELG